MEQAERDGVSRSQNIVYTLPRTLESLTQVITSPIERIDPVEGTLQLMILTPDAETALAVSDFAYQLTAPQGIEVVPVTSANRAARLIEGRPVHAVAGTPLELQTLVQRSTLKLDSLRTIVLAWGDDIVTTGFEGADALAAMEALFAELPKSAERVLVARRMNPELEQIAERYLWRARRFESVGSDEESAGRAATSEQEPAIETPVQYLIVSAAGRTVALQRLLDEIDPPSAIVLARTQESEGIAKRAIQQLGYRHMDAPIRVSRGDVPEGVPTVIFFDAPIKRDELARAGSVGAVHLIALVTPREIETLRELTATAVPRTLHGPGAAARHRDRILRDELTGILSHGIASRELLSLEPLLEQYDGIEIAAAAVRLLERERQKAQTLAEAAKAAPARSDRGERPFRGDRPDRGRKFGDDRGGRKFDRGDRGERKFERGDRGERGDRRDRGDHRFGDRDRKFSRGPDRKFDRDRRDDRERGGFRPRRERTDRED